MSVFLPVGDDPLSDSECDLDSVAGVLKLYFRGLEPPLFPYDSYSQLLECVRKPPSYNLCSQTMQVFSTCFQSLGCLSMVWFLDATSVQWIYVQ